MPEVQLTGDLVFDRRGYYRSPVTLADYRRGRSPANKGKKYPPEPLTESEAMALLDACGHGIAGRRNRALIGVMWRSGLRIGEALALYPKDLDTTEQTIRVLHGKGDKARIVGIDVFALALMDKWLQERRALEVNGRHPLFCVISKPTVGQPLHAAYVRELFTKLGVKAGIEKRVHPHGMRHTHADELARERKPLPLIQMQLGHSDLATTARYVSHIRPEELIAAIRDRSPGSKRAPETTADLVAALAANPGVAELLTDLLRAAAR